MSIEVAAPRVLSERLPRPTRLGPYLWLLPALALFGVFRFYPLLFGLFLSVHKWDGMAPMVFVGLANFREALFADPLFWQSLAHNAIYAVGTVIGKNVLALAIAILLNYELRGRVFFRTTLFMPVVMSLVVVGILWTWIYNYQFGLLNNLLEMGGLGRWRAEWLGSTKLSLYSLIFVDIWKFFGYHMVIYLAGLQAIPPVLYEAATIDGATAWHQFRHVTVPMLRAIIVINVTIALMGAFNVFDLVYVMTKGGPNNATSVVVLEAYQQAFEFYKLGYGAAISVILMVIVIALSVVQIRLMKGASAEEYK
jgi:raffinose/stachyose/melibiose transport system permease protein